MDDFLEALYCCDIHFTPNQQLDQQSKAALEDIIREEETVKTALSPEHWTLVEGYRDRVEDFHMLYAQKEFERGLLMGAKIISAILSRKQETPRQQ